MSKRNRILSAIAIIRDIFDKNREHITSITDVLPIIPLYTDDVQAVIFVLSVGRYTADRGFEIPSFDECRGFGIYKKMFVLRDIGYTTLKDIGLVTVEGKQYHVTHDGEVVSTISDATNLFISKKRSAEKEE